MDLSTFRFALRFLTSRFSRRPHPFLVQLVVTNRCNARCPYCYAQYHQRDTADMPLEDVRTLIDGLARAGTFRMNLVGGEPLVRKDIEQIIDHARARGIRCAMTTNGWLVPQKIDMARKLDTVCLSIDGAPEGNDQNRGPGSHAKTIAAMDACRREGIPLQMSAVLSRHTIGDVDYLVDLARQYGCRVGFTTLISQDREGREDGIPDMAPTDEDLRRALDRVVALKREGAPILFSTAAYELARRWPDYRLGLIDGDEPKVEHPACRAGKDFALIDYNGDVYPCPQLIGLFRPKNALRDGLMPALERAAHHTCRACPVPCSNEFSMFFGMDTRVLAEQGRHWLSR